MPDLSEVLRQRRMKRSANGFGFGGAPCPPGNIERNDSVEHVVTRGNQIVNPLMAAKSTTTKRTSSNVGSVLGRGQENTVSMPALGKMEGQTAVPIPANLQGTNSGVIFTNPHKPRPQRDSPDQVLTEVSRALHTTDGAPDWTLHRTDGAPDLAQYSALNSMCRNYTSNASTEMDAYAGVSASKTPKAEFAKPTAVARSAVEKTECKAVTVTAVMVDKEVKPEAKESQHIAAATGGITQNPTAGKIKKPATSSQKMAYLLQMSKAKAPETSTERQQLGSLRNPMFESMFRSTEDLIPPPTPANSTRSFDRLTSDSSLLSSSPRAHRQGSSPRLPLPSSSSLIMRPGVYRRPSFTSQASSSTRSLLSSEQSASIGSFPTTASSMPLEPSVASTEPSVRSALAPSLPDDVVVTPTYVASTSQVVVDATTHTTIVEVMPLCVPEVLAAKLEPVDELTADIDSLSTRSPSPTVDVTPSVEVSAPETSAIDVVSPTVEPERSASYSRLSFTPKQPSPPVNRAPVFSVVSSPLSEQCSKLKTSESQSGIIDTRSTYQRPSLTPTPFVKVSVPVVTGGDDFSSIATVSCSPTSCTSSMVTPVIGAQWFGENAAEVPPSSPSPPSPQAFDVRGAKNFFEAKSRAARQAKEHLPMIKKKNQEKAQQSRKSPTRVLTSFQNVVEMSKGTVSVDETIVGASVSTKRTFNLNDCVQCECELEQEGEVLKVVTRWKLTSKPE